MKITKLAFLCLLIPAFFASVFWGVSAENTINPKSTEKEEKENEEEEDADLPTGAKIAKEEYLKLRNEQLWMWRGFDTAKQDSRSRAIAQMERSERELAARRDSLNQPLAAMWQPLGPAPIPVSATTAYSGRVSAIAVHPTNPNIVYVGTAQGGLYRSLNGGTTWTPMLDGALSLAIGSIAIAPSDPTTVFVGTGESVFSADSFFGVGIYRITNADTTPVISGPLNKDAANADVFTGRSVSKIVVHPTNPNILFATSANGVAGIGGSTTGAVLPNVGVYRTTNALAASPTFAKLTVQGTLGVSRTAVDAVIEPDNPARLIVTIVGSGGDGGVYLSTNALDATPTFTRTLTTGDGSSLGRAELAINKVGGVVTVFAATGTAAGTLYKSVDGGVTFNQTIANNFCNPQCFYDIAVAVDQTDANRVYLGGSPTLPFGRSLNGGTSFTNSSSGLHVDTQAFAIAPSDQNIIYFGSDGGIWRTNNASATPIVWTTLNNATFSATQFQGISLHPTDRNYLLGGTQDNGTQFLAPDGITWIRSDGGDGGFSVIDQNATDTTNVVSYHTYFNSTGSQIGFARALTTVPPGDPNWNEFLGCGGTANGINCADATLFYAPMVRGPGNPNTLYFGTTNLYRSTNQGTTMTSVSGTLPLRISAIAIAPQNDDIRLVGTTGGTIYVSTTAGATTMTNITGPIPARYVGRVAIDPNNSSVAYVALNGFGLAAGQHIWKTTNLTAASPVWTAAGTGIPDVPVSTFVVDPANSNTLYAGTDIGVFRSTDGGTSWLPFSDNLPRVAVFGMELHPVHRVLRIATHGRGIWEYNLNVQNRRVVADFDGDGKTDISLFRPADGNWYVSRSSDNGATTVHFGANGDVPAPGDYDGDGKTDFAIFRAGTWYVLNSSNLAVRIENFGLPGDVAAANDYDGDSRTDLGVYRGGTWYVQRSTAGFGAINFGLPADKPQPADYDGDGKADFAIYRGSDVSGDPDFYVFKSGTNTVAAYSWGSSTDLPVVADYDGDTLADIAIYRPSEGNWYVLNSGGGFRIEHFGASGDIPSHGDYDGDGKYDLAVYRPSEGNWYILNSSTGVPRIQNFGLSGDIPIPASQNP